MTNETSNNLRLGLFVMIGLVVLILSLYLIGKNQSIFGSSFHARARFKNVNGLMPGNNVRFSGIQSGSVKTIKVIDDTTVEVEFLIDKKMKPFIHANALVSIGSEGLVGNKVIDITPGSGTAPEITDGGLMATMPSSSTDEIMKSLSGTGNNIQVISENLKTTVARINDSKALWRLLNDTTITTNLNISLSTIRKASEQVNELAGTLNEIADDLHNGTGTAGTLLNDKATANNIKEAVANINSASKESAVVMARIDSLLRNISRDIDHGSGTAHAVLKDSTMVTKLNNSLSSIEKGTAAFNENMEALKHNFLTRGYFRKQAKQKRKTQNQ